MVDFFPRHRNGANYVCPNRGVLPKEIRYLPSEIQRTLPSDDDGA